jgi:hypothetical protein
MEHDAGRTGDISDTTFTNCGIGSDMKQRNNEVKETLCKGKMLQWYWNKVRIGDMARSTG